MGGPSTVPVLLEDESNDVAVPVVNNATADSNESEKESLEDSFGE